MRFSILRAAAAAIVFAVLMGGSVMVQAKQSDSTPDPLAGVTVENLGSQVPAAVPDRTLSMLRLTLDPGVTITEHGHPGPVVLYVVEGTFGTTFTHGTGVVTRATTPGTPAATDDVEMGEDYILNPGDTVAYDEGAHHIMRNEGDGPLVLLATVLLTTDQPGFLFVQQ